MSVGGVAVSSRASSSRGRLIQGYVTSWLSIREKGFVRQAIGGANTPKAVVVVECNIKLLFQCTFLGSTA
ncbi:hypothetical protein LR48_Vigan06g123700 [Vigna angularis]|uniref:Uncharacterized protein n=1 Tax=Phaseolus angularis TaxID=3914 RepID=A0A0L9UT77_PHAAN|nr:hypothetical protein LR48_Vigan06g123700 [Vigna angularis]